jgi:hypothetical protein
VHSGFLIILAVFRGLLVAVKAAVLDVLPIACSWSGRGDPVRAARPVEPRWLERVLPRLDAEGEATPAAGRPAS